MTTEEKIKLVSEIGDKIRDYEDINDVAFSLLATNLYAMVEKGYGKDRLLMVLIRGLNNCARAIDMDMMKELEKKTSKPTKH